MLNATDLIVAGYGTSTKSQPNKLATEATELRRVVMRALQGLFAIAARVNPEFYGVRAPVNLDVDHWPRPATAESVWRIERAAGEEVIVVPSTDRQADVARPALYRLGRKYYSAGNAGDPVAEALTFYYSDSPTPLASIEDNIDPRFPDQFGALLEYEIGMYLALKDGRGDDAANIKPSRDSWVTLYGAHLEHETTNEVRRFGHTRTFHLPSLLPLLAGGGS